MKQPEIASLAVISDRLTCALLDREGTISWYCPHAFDRPAILSSLIDMDQGGFWDIETEGKQFKDRSFDSRSSVLYTRFTTSNGDLTLTDFMPMGADFHGICRLTSAAPVAITGRIKLRANYGLADAEISESGSHRVQIGASGQWLHCSHPLHVDGDVISYIVPKGDACWLACIDKDQINDPEITAALQTTLDNWEKVESLLHYEGPYEREVYSSLRAIQQLVYEPTGGIVAAPTAGLPEVIGGGRNYDYRYVWMRDAALIVSSLVGLETSGQVELKFISFVSGAMQKNDQSHVLCFYGIDQHIRQHTEELPLAGYRHSAPVRIGNIAADQFQLDAESSILLACDWIYQKYGDKVEWDTVERIADYICKNWERKDNGIWEEEQVQHYTSSKAFAARALEAMAAHQPDRELAERWLKNARLIREFIQAHCMTSYGAYAVYAGSEDVDVTCALFAPFQFDQPNSPAMRNTIAAIEKNYQEGGLYRRHLVEFDSAKEGVFLAGSCWMAHYYAMSGELAKAESILDALVACTNDLGYFSEEMDLKTHAMLGNFPQTFVHSSFICAVNGYKKALAMQAGK